MKLIKVIRWLNYKGRNINELKRVLCKETFPRFILIRLNTGSIWRIFVRISILHEILNNISKIWLFGFPVFQIHKNSSIRYSHNFYIRILFIDSFCYPVGPSNAVSVGKNKLFSLNNTCFNFLTGYMCSNTITQKVSKFF